MVIPYTKYRKIYFIFSAAIILASVAAIFVYGLKPGLDFVGGSILELNYKETRPSNQEIENQLKDFDLGAYSVQPTAEKGVIIRMKEISEETHAQILEKLAVKQGKAEEIRFEMLGAVIGKELKDKTILFTILSILAIVVYIAISFRRVQRPLRSWQYGLASLISLFHDIIIPLGVFAVLGKYQGVEISIPIITALLTVLGASINNTVVVFDRIRENILKAGGNFEEIVDKSLNQTLTRQINTSLTVLFPIAAIFFFGGATLKYFALALMLGMIAGAYSSFFISSPLLVSWLNFSQKRKKV